jgi:Peptidase family M28/PA domain
MRKGVFGLLAAGLLASALSAKPTVEEDLRAHIAVLASDDFEGREPGTEGERKTVAYISDAWAKAGLKPAAADGSWLEPVALVRRGPGSATFEFKAKGDKLRFADDEIMLVGTEAQYAKAKLPVIFAGYGITSDGKAAGDVAGKVVLMLADRPDFAKEEFQTIRARRLALVAAGAEAVIVIGGEQAEYPLIRRQLMTRPIAMQSREKRAPLEGVVGAQFAVALITKAGGDWDKLRKAANSGDYAGTALGITADFDVKSDVQRFDSYNVIGKIAGKKPGSGAVLYMGHWDHLGICRAEGEADRICNGAVDNASGIAMMIEVAEVLAKAKHDRDIYFVATTAEESGLYGAHAFAEKPVLPLDAIVAAFNIDTIAIAPRGARISIIGRGTTPLDPVIDAIAKKAKRKVDTSTDANAFIRRQDGWALAEKGVPAVMIGSAFGDLAITQKFLASHYHGPDDELTEGTELGGAAEDTALHIALGKHFANAKKYTKPKAPMTTSE